MNAPCNPWRDEVQRLSEMANTAICQRASDQRNILEDIANRLCALLALAAPARGDAKVLADAEAGSGQGGPGKVMPDWRPILAFATKHGIPFAEAKAAVDEALCDPILLAAPASQAAVSQQAGEDAGLLADAERYQWLRRCRGMEHDPLFTVQHEIDGTLWGGDLDAAIDAARQRKGEA